jgi:hypothetical protein
VQHLRLTLNHIQASLDNIMRGQLKQESYLRQRNELMGRREDVCVLACLLVCTTVLRAPIVDWVR